MELSGLPTEDNILIVPFAHIRSQRKAKIKYIFIFINFTQLRFGMKGYGNISTAESPGRYALN